MKFLLIAGHPDSLLNFRGALLDSLTACGLLVHVAAPDLLDNKTTLNQLKAKGVVVHDIPLRRTGTNPLSDLVTFFSLYRLMRSISPDIVLAYTIKPVIYGSLAAWLTRTPKCFTLITGLGYAFIGIEKKSGLRALLRFLIKRLYYLALTRSSKVFFQNPDDEALFRSLGILTYASPSFIVNGSGIDLLQFKVAPIPDKARFLLISRFIGDKGIREYVAAARKVRAFHSDVEFCLVGWIDENPDSIKKQELNNWINEGVIKYLGRLTDVRPAIADCSVYVLPSYREGTPRTVLEAMAMGRAIITTDAPGCRETVVDGDNGFLVPVKSVDALVDAMLRFVSEPDLACRMGARGRQIAEQKYDVHKVNAVMLREMDIIK